MISGSNAVCEIFRKTSVYNLLVNEHMNVRPLGGASRERFKTKKQCNADLPEIICFREKLDRTGKRNENAQDGANNGR